MNTNPYSTKDKQYHRSAEVKLPIATNNTALILRYAVRLLNLLFRAGYEYKRAGIMLMDLTPAHQYQSDLFSNRPHPNMDGVRDLINQRYGRDCIQSAKLISTDQSWRMKQHYLSRPFTTSWAALPVAS